MMTCANCGADVAPGDVFCETCGMRQPDASDRVEQDHGVVAGISDRGLRHHRNEDAFAIRLTDDTIIAVVCDGVSTSDRPDQASRLAVSVAADLLAEGGDTLGAIVAAAKAVTGLAGEEMIEDADSAPACTYVSAIIKADKITVGWVGDSRAYWLSTTDANWALTVDDSWATEMVKAGRLTAEQAAADPRAHALTGWLGADATPEQLDPHVFTFSPAEPGVLLLCSDGLWNYAPEAETLAALVCSEAHDGLAEGPFEAAKTLVSFAIARGGQDNVTVVVAPFPRSQA